MTFSWTAHRFAGGVLALDAANSVILRFDPGRSIDRFADPAALDAFAAAHNRFSAERALFGPLKPVLPENRAAFIDLREAIDRHFRHLAQGTDDPALLAGLLTQISATLRRSGHDRQALDTATAYSALTLAGTPPADRLKICSNCGWLFLDRSRNKSRAWCDMAVCGNRAKASRHYHRHKDHRP